MKLLIALLLAAVGILHLVPTSGVFGNDALARLYGTSIDSPDLEILMRHRAVLFGIVGALLVAAAFSPRLQVIALVTGFVSVASFLVLAVSVGDYGPAVARVVQIDIVALVALAVAAGCRLYLDTSG